MLVPVNSEEVRHLVVKTFPAAIVKTMVCVHAENLKACILMLCESCVCCLKQAIFELKQFFTKDNIGF
jgi:hypothetical protein